MPESIIVILFMAVARLGAQPVSAMSTNDEIVISEMSFLFITNDYLFLALSPALNSAFVSFDNSTGFAT